MRMAQSGFIAPSAQSQQFFDRISAPTVARKVLYASLIDGLVNDGIWTKLDALWIYAADDSATALINLVSSSFTCSLVNGGTPLTFTANSGFNNGGTTSNASYINTAFDATTAGGNFTQNSNHISGWVANSSTTSLNSQLILNATSGTAHNILPLLNTGSNVTFYRANDSGSGFNVAVSNRQGFYNSNRSGASAMQGYKTGSSQGSTANASSALTAGNFGVLGIAGLGTYNNLDVASCASVGASLSSTEQTNFYNRLRAYMTAVGVP